MLEDQLLTLAEGSIIIVAFEGGRNVMLPKVQIPVRIPLKGLVSQPQRSKELAKGILGDGGRHPERDHELALRQLTQPFPFRDRNLRIEEVRRLHLFIQQRN